MLSTPPGNKLHSWNEKWGLILSQNGQTRKIKMTIVKSRVEGLKKS
jgi:hypothetical protein